MRWNSVTESLNNRKEIRGTDYPLVIALLDRRAASRLRGPDSAILTDEGHTSGGWTVAGDHSKTVSRAPRIWLILQPGQPVERAVEISGPRAIIGRGDDCDLVLDDPTVSRRHAVISMRLGNPPVIEDLGSENGTYVNGRQIRSPVGFTLEPEHPRAELRGGEWIQIGDMSAIVSLLPPNLPDPNRSSD